MKTKSHLIIPVMFAAGGLVFGQDLGKPTSSTPYDAYLGPMRTTLNTLGDNKPPVGEVTTYVRTSHGFRYNMKNPYVPQTPVETETSRSGDCKAKSLWVAYKMDDHSVHFVIGKARAVSGMSHAWLLWRSPAGWLILDPTNFSTPLDLNRVGSNEFVPLYSYTAGGKFIHAAAFKAPPAARYGDHL